jgi:hypothetical protein
LTIPPAITQATTRVSDFLREMIPKWRTTMTPEEAALAVHLRGNDKLMASLRDLIMSRIGGRASLPEPSDLLTCKSWLARDRELQWLLGRLEALHRSPVMQPADNREPSA